jgi:uncharacterized protein
MDVTAKLLRVFQVEKQLRGLQSRLSSAEQFLAVQDKDLRQLSTQRSTLEQQVKQYTALALDREGEMKRLDEKIAAVRAQMESAQTNKQYQAFLLELNNFRTDRDKFEAEALELMQKADDLRKQLQDVEGRRSERDKVRGVAASDREVRYKEIEARLVELKGQRDAAASAVPGEALAILNRLLTQRGENAMAPVQVEDRKRHEFTCGACQMSIPIDAVSALMSNGRLTLCSSCQCILYMDVEATKAMNPPSKRGAKSST